MQQSICTAWHSRLPGCRSCSGRRGGAQALEHRVFEAVKNVPRTEMEKLPDEWRLHLADPKTWKPRCRPVSRVLKGWQEEADPGSEKRSWRWLVEGDTDANGFDHTGEQASIWLLLRVSLDRIVPGEPEKGEDLDLEGFCIRVWANGAS